MRGVCHEIEEGRKSYAYQERCLALGVMRPSRHRPHDSLCFKKGRGEMGEETQRERRSVPSRIPRMVVLLRLIESVVYIVYSRSCVNSLKRGLERSILSFAGN